MRGIWVYLLRCADGKYYTGTYRGAEIEARVWEHNHKVYPNAFTAKRLPVQLVWAELYPEAIPAIIRERQIKGWSRAKKEALIQRDWQKLQSLASRKKLGD